jgi:hypothetical protein
MADAQLEPSLRTWEGSVHGRGVISAESAVEKLADPAVELGWSPRRAF